METLKQTIKELATAQRSLKNQRKSVKIIGERTMSPYEAFSKHLSNRDILRHMYAAYAILRERDYTLGDSNHTELSMSYIDRIKEEYKDKVK